MPGPADNNFSNLSNCPEGDFAHPAVDAFFGSQEREGDSVLSGRASPPNRSIGLLEKKFAEILEDSELSGTYGDRIFRDAANQKPSKKPLRQTSLTGQAPVWTANSGRNGNIL